MIYVFIGICCVLVYFLWRQNKESKHKDTKLILLEKSLERSHKDISNLHASIESLAASLSDKDHKFQEDRSLYRKNLEEHYKDQMEIWKKGELERAVKDSVNKSRSILRGKTTEQLVPLTEEFLKEFIPSDAKFLGSPIDYVIFSGAGSITDGEEKDIEIIFMDIKTGKARLTKVQRAIKKAVEEKRIRWKTFEIT
jgi:predicted Holliday junction resolvase-like endonuclease